MTELTWVVLVLEILVGGVLIPIGWRISSSLSKIFTNIKTFTDSLEVLCTTMKGVTDEQTEARVRDAEFKKDIENIKVALGDHIIEERNRGG